MTIKSIGNHTLSEILPHLKEIATQHQLKINRVKDLGVIRKILAQRFYSAPTMEDSIV